MDNLARDLMREVQAKTQRKLEAEKKRIIPPKLHELELYIFDKRFSIDREFAEFIKDTHETLDKKVASMDWDEIRITVNGALYLWNNERDETTSAIGEYIALRHDEKKDSYFHCVAIGLWIAWSSEDERVESKSIDRLVADINKQIIRDKTAPEAYKKNIVSGGTPKRADAVGYLMEFVDCDLIVQKAAKKLKIDPKTLRDQLKQVVGEDYKDIFKTDHRFHLKVIKAYQYWKGD